MMRQINVCPVCDSTGSKVIDSRVQNDGTRMRMHECPKCGYHWQTIEMCRADYMDLEDRVKSQLKEELGVTSKYLEDLIRRLQTMSQTLK